MEGNAKEVPNHRLLRPCHSLFGSLMPMVFIAVTRSKQAQGLLGTICRTQSLLYVGRYLIPARSMSLCGVDVRFMTTSLPQGEALEVFPAYFF
jgi:hypothetical protein